MGKKFMRVPNFHSFAISTKIKYFAFSMWRARSFKPNSWIFRKGKLGSLASAYFPPMPRSCLKAWKLNDLLIFFFLIVKIKLIKLKIIPLKIFFHTSPIRLGRFIFKIMQFLYLKNPSLDF